MKRFSKKENKEIEVSEMNRWHLEMAIKQEEGNPLKNDELLKEMKEVLVKKIAEELGIL